MHNEETPYRFHTLRRVHDTGLSSRDSTVYLSGEDGFSLLWPLGYLRLKVSGVDLAFPPLGDGYTRLLFSDFVAPDAVFLGLVGF